MARNADNGFIEYVIGDRLALSLHWRDEKVVRLDLRWADATEESADLTPPTTELKAALALYESRRPVDWPDLPFDFSPLSDFQKSALDELAKIPLGTTRTYGEMAALLGQPGGAQAVGRAMGANPFPLIYPCHRVVGADGSMTGFSASGGVEMKEYLLRLEGAAQPLLSGL